jgi:hypothetical protein
MEQAVLDILFNKKVWSDPSTERRNVWYPDACSTAENGNIVVKEGSKLSMLFRIYDEFGIYPRNLKSSVTNIEDSWYVKFNDDNTPKIST